MFRIILPLILAIAALTGCATGPKYVPAPEVSNNKVRLYIYRPWQFVAGGLSPTIHIDDKPAFDIINGGYAWFNINPGKHFIEIKKPRIPLFSTDLSSKAEVTFEPGKTYYVRWTPTIEDMQPLFYYFDFKGNMLLMKEDIAMAEIKSCKLLKTSYVPD
ncbi:MAG: DUF2846 domain-containing protein [Gammaproteobacteria bacterium]|nr:DUF2846 domain-containing protein [Gammaproteobacteria bacterium]